MRNLNPSNIGDQNLVEIDGLGYVYLREVDVWLVWIVRRSSGAVETYDDGVVVTRSRQLCFPR